MNRKSYGSSRSPRSEMEIQMETHKFWTLRSMTQAVRERVLKLAFPDRSPLVVGSGADLFVVCRPDPENHPMTYTRHHLGTLGEEYAQLPVPPLGGDPGGRPLGGGRGPADAGSRGRRGQKALPGSAQGAPGRTRNASKLRA